jgi:hypothetical protein
MAKGKVIKKAIITLKDLEDGVKVGQVSDHEAVQVLTRVLTNLLENDTA